MSGYSPRAAEQERAIETRYHALISSDEIAKFHRHLTAEPHPAGSARNNELARWVAQQWREQGLEDVTIHEYDVLNSSPREISIEMVKPTHFLASLREDAYDADADTKNPNISGAYLGYSASGEVTAPLVYAHSGNPEDYEYLKKLGIDVRGKIVLVRYSNPYSYRGFKALTAERLGAAAILIYSDPAEDGFKRGTVFPDGPWGPEGHIQRGAITYDFLEPGDPLTPGWASVPGAKRIAPDQALSLPKIMGVPLSWRDAKPLLENMGGPLAPTSWQGGLPLKYRLGGKRVRVHLKVDMNTHIQPYYVTEGRIRGEDSPETALKIAEQELRQFAPQNDGQPVIDLIFLGMGEDGHIASLFPNANLVFTKETKSKESFLYVSDSPKPPPRRISLTFNAITMARAVWVLASGVGKETALRNSLSNSKQTPLGAVIRMRKSTVIFSDIKIVE